jgi:hypothetical protein
VDVGLVPPPVRAREHKRVHQDHNSAIDTPTVFTGRLHSAILFLFEEATLVAIEWRVRRWTAQRNIVLAPS